jgi:hypothetical protein
MKTYTEDRERAEQRVRIKNRAYRAAGNGKDVAVLVDGPGENEQTVMELGEAIENDFLYAWFV